MQEAEDNTENCVRFGKAAKISRSVPVKDVKISVETVSLESEVKALKMLNERLMNIKKDWPTTMQEDEEALEALTAAEAGAAGAP